MSAPPPDNSVPMEERERLVAESAMFGSLSPEARAFVAHHLEPVNLPGGAHLMREGEAGDSLFFVAVGRLRVTMTRDDGTEALLAELGRGEVVGELAVMTNEPRSADVTALRDSQVLELSGDAFSEPGRASSPTHCAGSRRRSCADSCARCARAAPPARSSRSRSCR